MEQSLRGDGLAIRWRIERIAALIFSGMVLQTRLCVARYEALTLYAEPSVATEEFNERGLGRSRTEVTSQTKTVRLKAARCLLQMRSLSAGIVGVDIAQDRPAESRYGK